MGQYSDKFSDSTIQTRCQDQRRLAVKSQPLQVPWSISAVVFHVFHCKNTLHTFSLKTAFSTREAHWDRAPQNPMAWDFPLCSAMSHEITVAHEIAGTDEASALLFTQLQSARMPRTFLGTGTNPHLPQLKPALLPAEFHSW